MIRYEYHLKCDSYTTKFAILQNATSYPSHHLLTIHSVSSVSTRHHPVAPAVWSRLSKPSPNRSRCSHGLKHSPCPLWAWNEKIKGTLGPFWGRYLGYKSSICNLYIPGTYLSFVLGIEPSKRRPFPIKTRVTWVPGMYNIEYTAANKLYMQVVSGTVVYN